ncbi:MAG TPA: hypothetical protein VE860_19650 [Chthoniobacterales bacterium]|jgi:hypothetical protein|nr:hypothetical protein [Chthoniobacterales bacterium]
MAEAKYAKRPRFASLPEELTNRDGSLTKAEAKYTKRPRFASLSEELANRDGSPTDVGIISHLRASFFRVVTDAFTEAVDGKLYSTLFFYLHVYPKEAFVAVA